MTVRSLTSAEGDIRRIADHLEAERTGLRKRFVLDVRRVVANLRRFPQMYPLVDDDVPGHELRNAILERLNYRIVDLVRPDELVILAVAHTSRRPGHWHGRLDEETLS